MKLAIVRQKYTPYGGAERFVERAMAALIASGADVSIIARQWRGEAGTQNGVICNPFYIGRTWRDAGFAKAVQQIVASGRFDLIQSHERIPGCDIYRAGDGVHATWLALRNKPLDRLSVWHRYTVAAETAMFCHPRLRAVICNSHMVRKDIAHRFDLSHEKLHVIYNGVDLEHFHPRLREMQGMDVRRKMGINDNTPVILFVGSGYERKGVSTLLRALVLMKQNNATLLVVGRDKDEAMMRKLAQTLDVDQRVVFLGGQTDVRPYYGAADVFALPTLYDPFPNAVLEALACGLPVATTATCGGAELINEANGAVVRAGDAAELAVALDKLCANSHERRSAARASVAQLGLSEMAGRLADVYATLLK